MSDDPITDAALANLKGTATQVQRIAPGPWDRETETVSGESIAFNELGDANGKVLADSFNSDLAATAEEWDEDGCHLFDGGTLEIFEYLSTWHPLTALRVLAEVDRLRGLLELATNDQETYDYRRGRSEWLEAAANIGTVLDVPYAEGILSEHDKGYVEALRDYTRNIRNLASKSDQFGPPLDAP